MDSVARRHLLFNALAFALIVQIGSTVWTLFRYADTVRLSPGMHYFTEPDNLQPGARRSATTILQEGTWFHLIKVRREQGLKVKDVEPGSPAERAGLQAGDLIVVVNDIRLSDHPEAYFQLLLHSQPNDALTLTWRRHDQEYTQTMMLVEVPDVRSMVRVGPVELDLDIDAMTWFQRGPYLAFPLVLLIFGCWLGYMRLRHTVAYYSALFLFAMALSTSPAFTPMIAGWPGWALGLNLIVFVFVSSFRFFLILRILSEFPYVSRLGARVRSREAAILTPVFLWYACHLLMILGMTFGWQNGFIQTISSLVQAVPEIIFPIMLLVLTGVLIAGQWLDYGPRTRLQIIQAGFIAALVISPLWTIARPGTFMLQSGILPFTGQFLPFLIWGFDHLVIVLLKCALPVSFAYAILSDRIFGIRFVLGRGFRYLITSPVVHLLAGFCVFLVLNELFTSWFNRRGLESPAVLSASLSAGVAFSLTGLWAWLKQPVTGYFDCYLFRDQYAARESLREAGRCLSTLHHKAQILETTGNALVEALDLSGAHIYLHEGDNKSLNLSWRYNANGVRRSIDHGISDISDMLQMVMDKFKTSGNDMVMLADLDFPFERRHAWVPFETVVPIRGDSEIPGCIMLGAKRSEEPFSADEKDMIAVLATETGFALTNARLLEDIQQELERRTEVQRRLAEFSRQLVDVQESERRRLSHEIHDEAGQSLTVLKMSLEFILQDIRKNPAPLITQLQDAIKLTDDTMNHLRVLSHQLRPPALDTIGLNAALAGLFEDFKRRTRLDVAYHSSDIPAVSDMIATTLYRFVQEALTNVAKHANARHIEIMVDYDTRWVRVTVSDDGQGFSMTENKGLNGIGMNGMRERLHLLGGHLEFHTAPGKGTTLTAALPREEL